MWATNQIASLFGSIGIDAKKLEEPAQAETAPTVEDDKAGVPAPE